MTTLNFESARQQMIYHQIRPCDVLDERILHTLGQVHREQFVPDQHRALAFADTSIPLPCDQFMLKPMQEGKLLQALQAGPDDKTLLVGTGSGFLTACLAGLSDHVTSIELHSELLDAAAARLADEKIRNVDLIHSDMNTFTPSGSFDRILLTGSMPLFDPRLPEWLHDGGTLILITGAGPSMQVEKVVRHSQSYVRTALFETVVAPLLNVPQPEAFVFDNAAR
jgi:protein-L-isoaspartate(D-aspartate) O-methyltransferase